MPETLEKKTIKSFDSCIVEVPREFALANGFPEKCFVSLTLRNGRLESEIVEYDDRDEREVDEFISAFPDLGEERNRIGD